MLILCLTGRNLKIFSSLGPVDKGAYIIKSYFSYFSTKTYVMGTQKNRLNETVLLSAQIYVKTDRSKDMNIFTLKIFVHLVLYGKISDRQ